MHMSFIESKMFPYKFIVSLLYRKSKLEYLCAIVGVLAQRHQQCEKEMHVMMMCCWWR